MLNMIISALYTAFSLFLCNCTGFKDLQPLPYILVIILMIYESLTDKHPYIKSSS
jgi:hypothetical protein